MKPKSVILNFSLFLGLLFLGFSVTAGSLMDINGIVSRVSSSSTSVKNTKLNVTGNCTNLDSKQSLKESSVPELAKLGELQDLCESLPATKVMIFTDMPKDAILARNNAIDMAGTLVEFEKYGVTPVVVIEPTSDWGLIDFSEFNTGFYDNWINIYFDTLLEQGITDKQMGIWVPFPEANIPTWNKGSGNVADYAQGVNRYASLLKEHFPQAHVSLLLNSATYDNTDYDWLYGEYVSLRPYLEEVEPELIDSFGLQGFPWVPASKNAGNPLIEPYEFLNYKLALEAAEILGVKEVWFNTGTFGSKYTNDSEQTVYIDYKARKEILDKIVLEAGKLQSEGYGVWINLFAEDKSQTNEATDWSYFSDSETDGQKLEFLILKEFIQKLENKGIEFSYFDR